MKMLLKNGIGFHPPSYLVKPIQILVEDSRIVRVQEEPIAVPEKTEIYDLQGKLVIPGLVDCHTHLAQSFGRGIYDNTHLTQWLNRMNYNFLLTDEEVYLATQLACIEAIRSGTTAVGEMTTVQDRWDICIQAIADSGLRADVCGAFGDFQEGENPVPGRSADQWLDVLRSMHKTWHGSHDGRITVRISPVGLPACTEEFLRGSRDLANELGVGIHTHCCEGDIETEDSYRRFGMSEVETLEKFGVLGPDCQLVHCIWLTDHDKELIAEHDCSVVTCPSTNTKITDGMPPMPDLAKLGVNIAIGCDGEASSGSYDMLQEARLVTLLGKVSSMEADMFPAEEVFEMLTVNGAHAMGLADQIGAIQPGRKADLTVIRYPAAHLIDDVRLLSNLVYSATGGDVDSVFVDGKPLLWQGEMKLMDEQEVMGRILESMRNASHLIP